MLILTRKLNEKIKIGDDVTVTIVEIRGDQVKIGVEAPNPPQLCFPAESLGTLPV